jgi:radical SAM protein with 4Fe4S-binding SPASM domain
MSYETFVRIVDEVYKDTFMLLLWNQGEPFMNPDICKMMEYAHKKGLYLMLSTNANVMPPAESLINCGLDLLIISLDGSTQETYSKYRVGGSLDVVVDHVSSIVKAKDKHKRKFPIIVWQFLVMKHNEHEIDDIKHLSRKLGVDVLALKTVQIYSPDDIDTYLPSEQKHRRYIVNKEKKEFSTPRFKNRCFRIWYQPVINYNGDMSMCCFDKDITYHIGNIYKSSLYRLWKSENFMNHREVILTDRKRYMICRNCGEGTKLQI